MRNTVCLLAGLLALAVTQSTPAAKRLGPPIEDLQSTPDRIRIVSAQATSKPEQGKVKFAIAERLSGEAPDELLLRMDEETFDDVTVGESYVVAWTNMRRQRRMKPGWEEDPEGPSVVPVMGLGSTAVFELTPETALLFAPGAITDSQRAGELVDALLAQAKRPDVRTGALVIMELYLREDLIDEMTPAQVETLRDLLQTADLSPQNRDLLFRAALQLAPDKSSPWLAEELRRTIIRHGTQYDLGSYVPGLVKTAAAGLRQVGEPADIELLDILLYANNPGVAKAALAAIDHFDSGAAAARAEQALKRGWINDETRAAMTRYLETGTIR